MKLSRNRSIDLAVSPSVVRRVALECLRLLFRGKRDRYGGSSATSALLLRHKYPSSHRAAPLTEKLQMLKITRSSAPRVDGYVCQETSVVVQLVVSTGTTLMKSDLRGVHFIFILKQMQSLRFPAPTVSVGYMYLGDCERGMYEGSTLYYTLAILSAAYVINSVVTSEAYKLRKISTIGGSSWPVLSLWGAVRILRRGPAIIEEAYAKHKGSAFKFAEMRWWHVMVTGPLVDELFRAPEDMLSSMAAMRQMIQLRYTLGERMAYNNYFVGIVRMQFTRTLDQMYPSMREEIIAAFNDHLVLKEDEWTAVPLMASALPIVSRLSTHMFVGPSACRIPEFNQLMSDFAVTIHKTAILINLFPAVLHPIVGPLFSPLKSNIAKCASFIGPMIQERLDMRKQDGGDWEKPMDLLQLLIDAAPEEDLTVPGMCALSFLAGIGAIHTSSMSFVFALFHIASKPDEYLRALREEVDAVVAKYGWNRASLNEMRKLESFLMESQRLSGLGASNGIRLAVKDFYFSDGTFIPKGTMVSVPPNAIHKDEALYPDAETFKPWRFVQTDEGKGGKTSLVTTHPDYIPFGHGRHACPGRFFAVTELKSMIAYVVATYDVKMENEGVLPSKQSMGVFVFPDVKARVMFRKRQS